LNSIPASISSRIRVAFRQSSKNARIAAATVGPTSGVSSISSAVAACSFSSEPEMVRERLRRRLADVLDPERVDEPRQRRLLRSGDRRQHVLGQLLAHAVQGPQLRLVER
jgi:hypothetical protein